LVYVTPELEAAFKPHALPIIDNMTLTMNEMYEEFDL